MSEFKTSAIADEPVDILIALHPNFDLMDFAGPMEVFSNALHEQNDDTSRAFDCTIVGVEDKVVSNQGAAIATHATYKDIYDRLKDFDVLVVLGGKVDDVIRTGAEPLPLIKAFAQLQVDDPSRERTVLSVCTGSLMLAHQGILAGLSATTHYDFLTRFENICSQAVQRELTERTDVIDDARYVVNNLRFDLGDEDENPYIRRTSDYSRPSHGRKGSMSFKGSGRRESIARRAAMRLGGLRVITSGGVSAGVDAALYLVSALVSEESAEQVARGMAWTWQKGIVVDGLDV